MPTYVYACDSCGKQFEQFQSFKDEPLRVCPSCHQEGKVRRVIQPAGVVFKGSGWYINDSRGSSSSTVASSKGEAEKADPKPETKAAPTGGGSSEKSEKRDSSSANA